MAAPDAIGVGSAVAVAERAGVDVGEGGVVAAAAVGMDVAITVGVGSTRVAVGDVWVGVSGAGWPEQATIANAKANKQIEANLDTSFSGRTAVGSLSEWVVRWGRARIKLWRSFLSETSRRSGAGRRSGLWSATIRDPFLQGRRPD